MIKQDIIEHNQVTQAVTYNCKYHQQLNDILYALKNWTGNPHTTQYFFLLCKFKIFTSANLCFYFPFRGHLVRRDVHPIKVTLP